MNPVLSLTLNTDNFNHQFNIQIHLKPEACFSLVEVAWFSSFEAVAPICDVKKKCFYLLKY